MGTEGAGNKSLMLVTNRYHLITPGGGQRTSSFGLSKKIKILLPFLLRLSYCNNLWELRVWPNLTYSSSKNLKSIKSDGDFGGQV